MSNGQGFTQYDEFPTYKLMIRKPLTMIGLASGELDDGQMMYVYILTITSEGSADLGWFTAKVNIINEKVEVRPL